MSSYPEEYEPAKGKMRQRDAKPAVKVGQGGLTAFQGTGGESWARKTALPWLLLLGRSGGWGDIRKGEVCRDVAYPGVLEGAVSAAPLVRNLPCET